ncbi:PIN domain-containing protein [Salarchaeum sp. III]|uniref:type II toxin-antitoxin system VapC family toxin n=1 Tax=Salarchaeum sp. III TaxID=3107927 RepID=UPI002EDB47DB
MVAVVDSNILYGWRNENDEHHGTGAAIVDASKQPGFPTLHVPRVIYLEVVKHVHNELGYERALETIEMLRDAPQFTIIDLREADYRLGVALFRRHRELELPDAVVVAYMRRAGIEYIYSVDDDFDRFDDMVRLNAAVTP